MLTNGRRSRGMAATALAVLFMSSIGQTVLSVQALGSEVGDLKVGILTESKSCLVREPVKMIIEWQNTSDKAQAIRPVRPTTVTVSRNSAEESRYWLFQTMKDQRTSMLVRPVTLNPGQVFRCSFWLLLGRTRDDREWRFIFDGAGTYKVSLPENPGTPVEIEVRDPVADLDREALFLFSRPAAQVFLGETSGTNAEEVGVPVLEAIAQKLSNSAYAPYAALAMANYLWSEGRGFDVDYERYKRQLDVIIDKHPKHPLREEALYMLAQGYAFQEGKKRELAECARRLAAEYPGGEFTKRAEQWLRPEPQQPLVEKKPGAGRLGFRGLDRLPEGVREAYERYWRGVAAEDAEAVSGCLHVDYRGDEGDRSQRLETWRRQWRRNNVAGLEVEVEKAEPIQSYTRPLIVHAPRKTWTGEICLVSGYTSWRVTDLYTGQETTHRSSPSQSALMKVGNEWKIVSEHYDSRNRKAALLADEICGKLRDSFDTARIFDGKEDLSVYDELRERLSPASTAVKLSCRFIMMTMTGGQKDCPVFRVEVTVQPVGEGDAGVPSRHIVTLSCELREDKLQLVGIETEPSVAPE